MRQLSLLLLLILTFFAVATASAQDTVTRDEVNAVAHGLYCPVCESEPLDSCRTQACADWREEIRVQLSEGATEAEIHEYFRQRYGNRVLARPPNEGIGRLLWMAVPVAVVLGGLGFGRYLNAIRTKSPVTPAATSTSDDEYIQRIERELADKQ